MHACDLSSSIINTADRWSVILVYSCLSPPRPRLGGTRPCLCPGEPRAWTRKSARSPSRSCDFLPVCWLWTCWLDPGWCKSNRENARFSYKNLVDNRTDKGRLWTAGREHEIRYGAWRFKFVILERRECWFRFFLLPILFSYVWKILEWNHRPSL